MDKFVIKTKRTPTSSIGSSTNPNPDASNNNIIGDDIVTDKRARMEVTDDDIISDPGLRIPIEDYPIGIRDEVMRRYLAKGPCQPYGHNFPASEFGNTRRCFRDAWFKTYEWLEYSTSKDAAFCFWCYLFGANERSKHGYDAFTKTGFSNWKKATERFNEHVGGVGSLHNSARIQFVAFKNQRQSVSHALSRQSREMEVAYRTRLTAVVDVIRLCLLQGLPFRGNDESVDSIQKGNFLAILEWYSERNPEVAKVLNLNAPGNNQLTSSTIQRQIVSACAAETTAVILNELGDNFFSLLIDEARDSSVKEQMAVVIRYVNEMGEVVERFLGVVHVSDTSAKSLKSAIDTFFARNGLSLSRLRGQGYDGASNMRGALNGLKTLILNENPQAYFIHCFAHQLQLVVVAVAGGNTHVHNFFDYVHMIVNMIGASCKRTDALRQSQHDKIVERLERGETSTGSGQHQVTSLARPGDTRWGSHYKTIIRLLSLWQSVIEVLGNIYEDGTCDKNRATAAGLVDKMEDYEFVFIAFLMRDMLGITNELSLVLQQKDQNIVSAVRQIQLVKKRLQRVRDNGWDELLAEVGEFCLKNGISVPNMEDNVPGLIRSRRVGHSITYFHHFRVQIFLQVIDRIAQEMNNRFTESSTELLTCIACLDPRNSFSSFNLSKLLRLAELYPEDFVNSPQMELRQQLKNYIDDVATNEYFSDLHDIGALARRMVEMGYQTMFPLVYRLLKLALVLPIATATVERAFSAMNIIKTDLRNRMGDDLLNDCLVCYVEKRIFRSIENEVILQRFQNMQTRKIQLPPLSRSNTNSTSVNKN